MPLIMLVSSVFILISIVLGAFIGKRSNGSNKALLIGILLTAVGCLVLLGLVNRLIGFGENFSVVTTMFIISTGLSANGYILGFFVIGWE